MCLNQSVHRTNTALEQTPPSAASCPSGIPIFFFNSYSQVTQVINRDFKPEFSHNLLVLQRGR